MNIRLKKAFSDLWTNPGRTALVIFALVIGLWGVGSLAISATILQNDLTENFIRTSPPHALLTSKDFDRLDLEAFRNRPEVESAEFRARRKHRENIGTLPILLDKLECFG